MREIRGKLALVTGAASGIGRAIAIELARHGARLRLLDIDEAKLAATTSEVRSLGIEAIARGCDVSQSGEVHRAVEWLERRGDGLDILVNNAGIAYYGPTESMNAAQWDRLLAINLLAPIQFTRELLGSLLTRPEAHILNVCSVAGLIAAPRLAAYHASKFALVGLSESLRAEYGPRGLGVTALCPGLVRTNIFQGAAIAEHKAIPRLPWWMFTSPEHVASCALRAIRRDEGLVLVTPLAKALWLCKRVSPALVDGVQRFRLKRRRPHLAPAAILECHEAAGSRVDLPTSDSLASRRAA